MSIDRYLGARHKGGQYDCLKFAADVWQDETGEDLMARLGGALEEGSGLEQAFTRAARGFKRTEVPVDPCIVLMRRPKTEPHVGVYIRGRVLHLTRIGARYVDLGVACLGYKSVGFYR